MGATDLADLTHWHIHKEHKELWHWHGDKDESPQVGTWAVCGKPKVDPNVMPTATYADHPRCMRCGVGVPKEMLKACELMGVEFDL